MRKLAAASSQWIALHTASSDTPDDRLPPTTRKRYGLAALAITVMFAVRLALQPVFGQDLPYLLFLIPVVASAWFGGVRPGLFATVLGLLGGTYAFVDPSWSFTVGSASGIARAALFGVLGVLGAALADAFQSARGRTAAAVTALRSSEQHLSRLIENIDDCTLLMIDPSATLTSWNSGGQHLLGYAAAEMLGGDVRRIFADAHGADDTFERQMRAAAVDGQSVAEAWCRTRDGTTFPAEIVLTAQRSARGSLESYSILVRDRSERQQSRAAILALNHTLQQRVQELETVLNVMPVGIVIADDAECRQIRGNRTIRELTELPLDASGDLPAVPEQRPRFTFRRDGRELTAAELPLQIAATHNRIVAEHEIELVLASGRRRALLAYAAPLHDAAGQVRGAVGAFLDISARKAAEAALRASQARLGGMIDTAMDAIVSVNQEQRIVVFNAAAESMFGQSAAAALGQPLDQFIPASAHAAHRRAIPAFGATGVTSRSMHRLQPLRALRADGREFPIEATVSQIGSGDEKLYTAIIRDVTERQCADEERAQILQREQAARAIAEDAVQLREVFLSIAAHELKTPLTALLGFAHVLDRRLAQNTSLGERERRAMGGIVEQGDRLRRLIETLLDLTRIQHGSLEMDLRPVDLTALCQRVAAQVRAGLDSHTLHVQIGPEAYVVAGDELRLEQVLQNLLQNAVKYSPEGGPILLRLQRMGDTVQLAVSDQGIGIPEDAQHRLFSQFFRASNVDPRRISGLGLGLYLVNEIVMAHGGTTDVASREGFGSTFSVHLPALGAQVPAAESSAA